MTATTAPNTPAPELIERVMDLPADQREELGHRLLDSVEDSIEWDEEWQEKIRRRLESYLADPSQVIDASVAIAEVRAMLARHRESRA